MFSARPFGHPEIAKKTIQKLFGESIRTGKQAPNMFLASPFGQLKTARKTAQKVFGESIRTGNKTPNIFPRQVLICLSGCLVGYQPQ